MTRKRFTPEYNTPGDENQDYEDKVILHPQTIAGEVLASLKKGWAPAAENFQYVRSLDDLPFENMRLRERFQHLTIAYVLVHLHLLKEHGIEKLDSVLIRKVTEILADDPDAHRWLNLENYSQE
jgi:hypothetical protein